jgi:osmotically inducible protein OsmC
MQSRAAAVWEGEGLTGKGNVTALGSGLFKNAPVSWAARSESSGGKTSPEELLAAAHSTCFAMAMAFGLAGAKKPATKLEVNCTVTFDKVGAGFKVTKSALEVTGWVPGMDAAAFTAAATGAKDGCPISQALKGNVEVTLVAKLG